MAGFCLSFLYRLLYILDEEIFILVRLDPGQGLVVPMLQLPAPSHQCQSGSREAGMLRKSSALPALKRILSVIRSRTPQLVFRSLCLVSDQSGMILHWKLYHPLETLDLVGCPCPEGIAQGLCPSRLGPYSLQAVSNRATHTKNVSHTMGKLNMLQPKVSTYPSVHEVNLATNRMLQRKILLRQLLQPNDDMIARRVNPRSSRYERCSGAFVLLVREDAQRRPFDVDHVSCVDELLCRGWGERRAVLERLGFCAVVENCWRHFEGVAVKRKDERLSGNEVPLGVTSKKTRAHESGESRSRHAKRANGCTRFLWL